MIIRIVTTVFLSIPILGIGQLNLHAIQNQHTSNAASSYFPSMLGKDCKFFEIDIFSFNIGAGNSLFSLYDFEQIGSGTNTQAFLNKKLDRARKLNTLYLGTDIHLLNTSIRIPLSNNTTVRGGFGIRQRNEFQFTADKNMLSLILNGNKQFAGKSVNLLPKINFLSLLDYHFTGSFEYNSSRLGGRRLTTAITLHRLTGLANFRSRESKLEFYTAPDGRYIELGAQLEVNTSSIGSSAGNSIDGLNDVSVQDLVKEGCGSGWGIDLGGSIELTDNIEIHAALIDLGFIRFNELSTTYSGNKTLRFEGVEVEGIYNPTISTDFDGDTLADKFKLDETKGKYTVGMPTKLLLCAQWHSPTIEKKRVPYSRHTASACIVQGFRNYLSASPIPGLNLGYTLSAGNILNIGVNTSIGGLYGGMAAGGFFSLRGSVVKFTLGSNNLAPLLSSRSGRFTDAYFGLSVLY